MKVYVAQRHYNYQGFLIIGIFTSEDDAKKCCDKDKQWGDYHSVSTHDLQESPEAEQVTA